jgi:hypothetical protein
MVCSARAEIKICENFDESDIFDLEQIQLECYLVCQQFVYEG